MFLTVNGDMGSVCVWYSLRPDIVQSLYTDEWHNIYNMLLV